MLIYVDIVELDWIMLFKWYLIYYWYWFMNIYDRFSWLIWARYLQIDQGSINQHVSNGKGGNSWTWTNRDFLVKQQTLSKGDLIMTINWRFTYHLVNQHSYWKLPHTHIYIYSWFTVIYPLKWCFAIMMLVYQRVNIINPLFGRLVYGCSWPGAPRPGPS